MPIPRSLLQSAFHQSRIYRMAQQGRSYASLFASKSQQPQQASSNQTGPAQQQSNRQAHTQQDNNGTKPPPKRASSPQTQHYTPKTHSPESEVYVLTLLTNGPHHKTMTSLRKQYFPPRLNKLDAHLTLFHALPGTHLQDSILPTLSSVAAATSPFPILAAKPFRLNKGIAIGVPKTKGGDRARDIHSTLQESWKDFLSEQDGRGGVKVHYTVMNKVDDEGVVAKAFEEVQGSWRGNEGVAEGLSLFRYEKGYWVHFEDFRFTGDGKE